MIIPDGATEQFIKGVWMLLGALFVLGMILTLILIGFSVGVSYAGSPLSEQSAVAPAGRLHRSMTLTMQPAPKAKQDPVDGRGPSWVTPTSKWTCYEEVKP